MRKVELVSDQRRFTMVYNDFLENTVLTQLEKSVFIYLKMYAGQKNVCYPSVKTLASKVGICEKTVKNVIAKLKNKGVIQVINRCDGKGKHSNLYILHDTKELWECQTEEEMIHKKEKALCAATQTGQVDKAHSSEDDTNTETAQSQERERYSLGDIRAYYSYDSIKGKANVDLAIETIHTFLNVNHAVTIQGQSISQMMLTKKLLDLTPRQIEQALDIYAKSQQPQNAKAYLLAILLSVADGKSKVKTPAADSKNRFTKFEQRAYDFESLEESLLNHT